MPGDLLIKGGTVVDGTGKPAYQGDVGVREGKVVDPSAVKPGTRVIDAEGKIVTPGFIDVHTHYDAQVMWDPLCTCSPWHGVTTVVMGNCGFTLAPTTPQDQEFIMTMFGRVEGMNVNALRKGLDWRWQTFPEYLDRLDEIGLGVNIGTMVGHSAVRRFVMGEAASEREADADEVQQMKAQVREALASGAFGFTTSLSATHYDFDGRPVPSRFASNDEVRELGFTLGEFPGAGSIEIITKSAVRGRGFTEEDQALLIDLAQKSGRPINWNELSQNYDRGDSWKQQLDFMERSAKQGAMVYAIARCTRLDQQFNLTIVNPFEHLPTWKEVLSQPREDAMELLRKTDVRATLKQEMDDKEAKTPDHRKFARVVFLKSPTGKYAEFEQMSLGEIAQKTGKHFVDVMIDMSLDEGLLSELAIQGRANGDSKAVRELINGPYSLAGISDAGAHTDRLSGSYFSTYLMAHWVRDEGAMTLEDAVRRLTSMPAGVYGISDRGTLEAGKAGDVAVFDLDALNWSPAERFSDFPGGEDRLGTRAEGYEHLIVDGEEVYTGTQDTGARPGQLLRANRYRENGS